MEFLEENNIIPMLQSPSRKHHSGETALYKIHYALVPSVHSRRRSDPILLDLSATFDTIDHEMLIDDLYEIELKHVLVSGICDLIFN